MESNKRQKLGASDGDAGSPGATRKLVLVWDIDETLVIFNSLLTGSWAMAHGGHGREMLSRLGERWEAGILGLADSRFFYKQIEQHDQTCMADVEACDDGAPLSSYNFAADGFPPAFAQHRAQSAAQHAATTRPLPDTQQHPQQQQQQHPRQQGAAAASTAAQTPGSLAGFPSGLEGFSHDDIKRLAYRYRRVCQLYRFGLMALGTAAQRQEWQELYEDTDAVTGRWLSHAASLLSACTSQLPLLLRQPSSSPSPSPRKQQQHAGEGGSGGGKCSSAPVAAEPAEGAAKAALGCAAAAAAADCTANGCLAQQQLPEALATTGPVDGQCSSDPAGLPVTATAGGSPGQGSPGQAPSAAAAAAVPAAALPLPPPPPQAAAAAAAAGGQHLPSPAPTAAAPASAPSSSVGLKSPPSGAGDAPEAGPLAGLEVVHVAVTSGQLIPSLAKLMLFRLAGHFAPDRVYSSRRHGKGHCFDRVRERWGEGSCYVVIGDGLEEDEAAAERGWPYLRVLLTDVRAYPAAHVLRLRRDALGGYGRPLPQLRVEHVAWAARTACGSGVGGGAGAGAAAAGEMAGQEAGAASPSTPPSV